MRDDDLRARLREQPAAVHYDVARGLARHRALVAAGVVPPAWAEPLARPRWTRLRALLGASVLATVTLVVWPGPASSPIAAPAQTEHGAPPLVRAREPGRVLVSRGKQASSTPSDTAPATPHAEPASSPPTTSPEPVGQPTELARPVTTSSHAERVPSSPAVTRRSRPRHAHALAVDAPAAEADSATRVARRAQAPSLEDNRELAQLVQAERALDADPIRALHLVREGELSFRAGYFAQERRYLEVMALFALGRLGEAHAHAAAFMRDFPDAPYRHKVELELSRQPQH